MLTVRCWTPFAFLEAHISDMGFVQLELQQRWYALMSVVVSDFQDVLPLRHRNAHVEPVGHAPGPSILWPWNARRQRIIEFYRAGLIPPAQVPTFMVFGSTDFEVDVGDEAGVIEKKHGQNQARDDSTDKDFFSIFCR